MYVQLNLYINWVLYLKFQVYPIYFIYFFRFFKNIKEKSNKSTKMQRNIDREIDKLIVTNSGDCLSARESIRNRYILENLKKVS